MKDESKHESLRIAKLEEELSKDRHTIRSLHLQLQREKSSAEEDRIRDTKLISQLRIQLNKALETRDRLMMEQKSLEVMNSMKGQDKDSSTGLHNFIYIYTISKSIFIIISLYWLRIT